MARFANKETPRYKSWRHSDAVRPGLEKITKTIRSINAFIKDLKAKVKHVKYTVFFGDEEGPEAFVDLRSKTKDGDNLSKADQDKLIKIVIDCAKAHGYKIVFSDKLSQRTPPYPDFAFVLSGAKSKKQQMCEWFQGCKNPATGQTPHPVLGQVPTCDRCAKFATGK